MDAKITAHPHTKLQTQLYEEAVGKAVAWGNNNCTTAELQASIERLREHSGLDWTYTRDVAQAVMDEGANRLQIVAEGHRLENETFWPDGGNTFQVSTQDYETGRVECRSFPFQP